MQQNITYPYNYPQYVPQTGANAVSINIMGPQAFASNPYGQGYSTAGNQGFYPIYGTNTNPNLPYYPMNYNNMMTNPQYAQYPQSMPPQNSDNSANSGLNALGETNLKSKTDVPEEKDVTEKTAEAKKEEDDKKSKDKKEKTVTILTDDYVKSLENYLDNDNPKIRLIGAKELLERFKEDDSRKANPSLVPLLNKILQDTSPSVRFLGLTILQLGYSTGDDETVGILKDIQSSNKDGLGDDALAASEILLKMTAPTKTEETE